MGKTNSDRQAEKTCRYLRVHLGGKKEPRQSRLTLARGIKLGLPDPPEEYLERAKALLDNDASLARIPTRPLMTIADFAQYVQVSTRRVKAWIRQKKLTSDNGLRTLPDGDQRIDLSTWERRLRYIAWPAVLGSQALRHHAIAAILMHAFCYTVLKHRLA